MPLIQDLIAELETAQALEQQRVDGGSDLIDIAQGNSTLMPKTVAALQSKLAEEQGQLNLIITALSALNALAGNGYPDRKVFDIPPEIAAELGLKQKQMADFANELRPILLGADSGTISIVAMPPSAPVAKKNK